MDLYVEIALKNLISRMAYANVICERTFRRRTVVSKRYVEIRTTKWKSR
jgi:hypothetical protein